MKRLVSIIIPVYNVEEYLERCINSILKQTYKNIEIILINDGSTDNSLEVCKKYSVLSNVKLLNKLNGGIASVRNEGLRSCSGEYVCFVDSDDYVDEKYIEILVANIVKYDADLSCCGFKRTSINDDKGEYLSEKIINENEKIIDYYLSHEMTAVWGKLYKMSLFTSVNFPEGKIYEDIVTNFKVLKNVKKMVVSYSKLYMYYVRLGSITMKPFKKNAFCLLDAWNDVVCDANSYSSPIIAKAKYRRDRVYFTLLGIIARYGFEEKINEVEKKRIIYYLKKEYDKCFINLIVSEYTPFRRKIAMACFYINYNLCYFIGNFLRRKI